MVIFVTLWNFCFFFYKTLEFLLNLFYIVVTKQTKLFLKKIIFIMINKRKIDSIFFYINSLKK